MDSASNATAMRIARVGLLALKWDTLFRSDSSAEPRTVSSTMARSRRPWSIRLPQPQSSASSMIPWIISRLTRRDNSLPTSSRRA